MNLKRIIVVASLFLTFSAFGQKDCFSESFWKGCETQSSELDSITFNNYKIYFYLVERFFVAKDGNNVCTFSGTVITPDLKIKLNRKEKQKVFRLINNKVNLVSFNVFSTCEAFQLSRTAFWSKKKEKILKKKLIGRFVRK